MYRFSSASTQYLEVTLPWSLSPPYTLGCTFRAFDTGSTNRCIVSLGQSAGQYYIDCRDWNSIGDYTAWYVFCAASGGTGSPGQVVGKTHQFVGICASHAERRMWVDGANLGQDLTTRTLTGLDRLRVAYTADVTPTELFDGEVGEVFLYNIALPDLAATQAFQISPLKLFPGNLIGYWPLDEEYGLKDISGNGLHLTAYNAPTLGQPSQPAQRYWYIPSPIAEPYLENPGLVQAKGYAACNLPSHDLAFDASVADGNTIIVGATFFLASTNDPAKIAISDDQGNTYYLAIGELYASRHYAAIWYAPNCAAGVTTITIEDTDVSNICVTFGIAEFEGLLATTGILDQTNENTATSTDVDSGNITTTDAPEILVGIMTQDTSSRTFYEDDDWLEVYKNEDYTTIVPLEMASRLVTETGTYAAGFTLDAAVLWYAAVASFKPASEISVYPTLVYAQMM